MSQDIVKALRKKFRKATIIKAIALNKAKAVIGLSLFVTISLITTGVLTGFFVPSGSASAVSSGPNSPLTGADDSSIGTITWSNPTRIVSSNNSYATAGLDDYEISHYLKSTNFSFDIPSEAVINGITAEIEKKSSNNGSRIQDYRVRIIKGGAIGATDRANANWWGTSDAYTTYGSSSDLWGESWTYSDINNANFGVAISAYKNTTSGGNTTASIDHIRITVTYTFDTTSPVLATGINPATLSYDNTAGTVDIADVGTCTDAGSEMHATQPYQISYSDAGTSLDANCSDNVYTVSTVWGTSNDTYFTGTDSHYYCIKLECKDAASTPNIGTYYSTSNILYDITAPTPIISTSPAVIYGGTLTATVQVNYGEAMNTGTSPVITLSGSNWGAQTPVGGGGGWSAGDTVYTATFAHNGTAEEIPAAVASIAAGSGATDAAGNPENPGVSPSFIVDTVFPTVASVDSDGQTYTTNTSSPHTITVVFSEDIANTPSIDINPVPADPQVVTDCGDADARTFCFAYTIPALQETMHTIHISGAQDAAGNVMVTDSSHTFTVDTIAPITSDNTDDQWHDDDQTITLNPSDAGGSGVANTYYCIDDAGTCAPDINGISVLVTCGDASVCTKYVRYYSVDNAGNAESVVSASNTVKIDKEVPSVGPTSLDGFTTYGSYIKGSGKVIGGAAADGAGLSGLNTATCEYTTDGSTWNLATWDTDHCKSETILVNNGESYQFNTRIADNVGHIGAGTEADYTGDNTAPTSSVAPPSAGSELRATAAITANASDGAGSGVEKVEFWYATLGTKIGNGAETSPGIYSIDWDTTVGVGDGPHNIWVVAYDNLGSYESSETIPVIVDNTAPTKPVADPAGGDYTRDVIVSLASADVNLDAIYYTLDGSAPSSSSTKYDSVAKVSIGTDTTLKAIAYDKVGNVSEIMTETYAIAPTISNESSSSVGTTSFTATWDTDDLATSRVIYDTVSHSTLGSAPNYGYANSTTEDAAKVTSHSVNVSGLSVGVTYYYRTVSHGSPEAVGEEKSATTTSSTPAPSGGGGGGGGPIEPVLLISEQSIAAPNLAPTSLTLTWLTNLPSSSYVIYGAEGQAHTLDMADNAGTPPKYGYANATAELDVSPKVASHTVTITGLDPLTIYYFRTVSRGSLAISMEYKTTTPAVAGAQIAEQTTGGETTGGGEEITPTNPVPIEQTPGTEPVSLPTTPSETINPAGIGNQPAALSQTANPFVAGLGAIWNGIFKSKLLTFFLIIVVIVILVLLFFPLLRRFKKK